MEFREFVDEYKYGGQLQSVLFGVFGWNKITVHLRGGAIFAKSQVSLFEDYSNGNYSHLLYPCFL